MCGKNTFEIHAVKLLSIYFSWQAVAVADLENIVKIAHGYHPPKMNHGPNVMWLDTTRGGVTHLIMGPTAGPTCYYPPHSDVHWTFETQNIVQLSRKLYFV